MSDSEAIHARIHPRHADTRRITEHARIARSYKPSARDIVATLADEKAAKEAEESK